jgi:hypothetical protein
MDRISRDLRRKQQEVKDDMDDLTEDDIDEERVSTVERDLARILEKRHAFRIGVREYLEEYNAHLEASAQNTCKDSIINMNTIVKADAKKIRAKVHQVSPPLHKYKIKLKYIRIPKQHACCSFSLFIVGFVLIFHEIIDILLEIMVFVDKSCLTDIMVSFSFHISLSHQLPNVSFSNSNRNSTCIPR